MKKALWAILGLCAGGVLGWIVLRTAMWSNVLEVMGRLDWHLLVMALGAVLLAGLIEAYRWKLLLPKERVSTGSLFIVKHLGQGLNNVSPVRVVAEVVQTAMLRYGHNVRAEKVVSSLLVARLFDLIVTMSLVGVGLIVLPQLGGVRPMVLPVWAIVGVAIVAMLALGKYMQRVRLIGRLDALAAVVRSMGTLSYKRRKMLGCTVLTVAAWMSIGVTAWLVARAVGIDLPFWLMSIVIVAVSLFSSTTPAPPGAVGVYEAGAIFALGLFSIDPSIALTFALVTHGLLFLPSIAIGIVGVVTERQAMKHVWTMLRTRARCSLGLTQ